MLDLPLSSDDDYTLKARESSGESRAGMVPGAGGRIAYRNYGRDPHLGYEGDLAEESMYTMNGARMDPIGR